MSNITGLDRLKQVKDKELEDIKTTNKFTSLPVKQQASEELVKVTFYLTNAQNKALDFAKSFEGLDKSEYVRAKLDEVIPQKYIDMAKEFYNK